LNKKTIRFDSYQFWLVIILCVGALLRFYRLWDIPYTPDEFSALGRLNFDTFSAVINQGVKPDGHPAGVQVFLYFWTQWWGREEWVVKLPFLLMGVGAIYYAFGIGRKWFNEYVGLLTAAFLAVLQISVMYSQIARPYGSGLIFTLAMVYYWTSLMQVDEGDQKRHWLGYVFFSVLCAYNHHFSLLMAGMVWVTGLVMSTKNNRTAMWLAAMVMILLYVPHIPIFFAQLETAGIGSWLSAPTIEFVPNYIAYIFHFSYVLFGLIGVILILSWWVERKIVLSKWMIIAWCWFWTPLIIGYVYSVYRAPLLQYSVLIFSFPFLLLGMFGSVRQPSSKVVAASVGLILLMGSWSLIFERQHYVVTYDSDMFRQIVLEPQKTFDSYEQGDVAILVAHHPEIMAYYRAKYKLTYPYEHFDKNEHSLHVLFSKIKQTESEYYALARMDNQPLELVQMVRLMYPVEVERKNFTNSEYWVFYKGSSADAQGQCKHEWDVVGEMEPKKDRIVVANGEEFSPSYDLVLSEYVSNPLSVIDVLVRLSFEDSLVGEVVLVMDLVKSDGSTVWNGRSSLEYNDADASEQFVFLSIDYYLLDKYAQDELVAKVYLWNKEKIELTVEQWRVCIRDGNPVKFAVWQKF
jgi:hypothetical protein